MAESVVKLKIDSGEYDSKIKRAAQNVLAFGENCQKAGQSVAKADKDTLDYVRSIGQMETVAKNTKGKINEMTTAFTELSVQYKNLTDEEKKSQFGVALSQSLDQLKTRIGESKAQLTEVNAELGNTSSKGNETGGIMQQLAGKFTLTLDAVKLFNIGVKAVGVALDVAKDAFFASEATVDEWGRTMDANRSLYEGFLNAINNGDISGFLSNINQIISAARAAYDELDRLGTMRTIQAPQISAQQAENDRLRQMIQTGRWISAPGKDSLGMKDGQILTPAQIRTFERMLNNGVQTIVTLTKNEVQQTGKTINAFYNRQSRELNMSEAEFRKGTSSMAEFDKRMAGYDAYKKWDADAKARFAQQGGRGFVDFDKSNPYAEYRRWGTFRVDGDRYKELVQLIQQRDQQTSSMYNMQGQAYRTINRAEGITTRGIMGGGGGGRTGGGGGRGGAGGGGTHQETEEEKTAKMVKAAQDAYTKTIKTATMRFEAGMDNSEDLQKKELAARERLVMAYADAYAIIGSEAYKNSFSDAAVEFNKLADVVKGKREKFEEATATLVGMSVNNAGGRLSGLLSESMEDFAKRKDINIDTSKMVNGAKEVKEGWQDAAHAVMSVGDALQQIEDPGAKVAGIIGQAIANIALGFAQATAAAAAGGPFAWIAAIAGGLGTMLSTIAAIKSATAGSYAEGGIIPGNNYNDGLIANVSSGELILNRAQQNSIAGQLTSNQGNGESKPYLDVETIWLGLGHFLKRKGMGEIVTTR